MTRIDRAVLAAFLCSATAPATMCDPTGEMTPFAATQWTTLPDSEVMLLPDATVVLLERPAVDARPGETTAEVNTLPSTSTAP